MKIPILRIIVIEEGEKSHVKDKKKHFQQYHRKFQHP